MPFCVEQKATSSSLACGWMGKAEIGGSSSLVFLVCCLLRIELVLTACIDDAVQTAAGSLLSEARGGKITFMTLNATDAHSGCVRLN